MTDRTVSWPCLYLPPDSQVDHEVIGKKMICESQCDLLPQKEEFSSAVAVFAGSGSLLFSDVAAPELQILLGRLGG